MGLDVYATKVGRKLETNHNLELSDVDMRMIFERAATNARADKLGDGCVDGYLCRGSLDCSQAISALEVMQGAPFVELSAGVIRIMAYDKPWTDPAVINRLKELEIEPWAIASAKHFILGCSYAQCGCMKV